MLRRDFHHGLFGDASLIMALREQAGPIPNRAAGAGGHRLPWRSTVHALLLLLLLVLPDVAHAQAACRFTSIESVMLLASDCVTQESIEVPDGYTLDGNFHTIVAMDPPGDVFRGAIVVGRGSRASVVNTGIVAAALRDVCLDGRDRLRGIYFEGASGVIRGNSIDQIRKLGSACEEGTAIEVRNPWTGADPSFVTIESNIVDRYQKSGIVLHGHVDATVTGNVIGASASQALVAANSIQVGPGARATVEANTIVGNTHPSARAAGTAVLLVGSGPGTTLASNVIIGNSDVGVHVMADGAIVIGNQLTDEGPDGYWDVGIVNLGVGNVFIDNTVEGYRVRVHGLDTATPIDGGHRIE